MPGRTGSNDLPGVADGVDSVLDANDVLVLRCEIRHQLRQVVRDADQCRIIDQHVVAKEAQVQMFAIANSMSCSDSMLGACTPII